MSGATDLTFPLVPRRRLIGLAFGAVTSVRRGTGSDVASSRPYQPGDDVDTIDWAASARLSYARGTDEFVVRERYAEEAPRVVIVDQGFAHRLQVLVQMRQEPGQRLRVMRCWATARYHSIHALLH